MKKVLGIALGLALVAPLFMGCSDDDKYKCKDSDAECIVGCLFDAETESDARKCAKCVDNGKCVEGIDIDDDDDDDDL